MCRPWPLDVQRPCPAGARRNVPSERKISRHRCRPHPLPPGADAPQVRARRLTAYDRRGPLSELVALLPASAGGSRGPPPRYRKGRSGGAAGRYRKGEDSTRSILRRQRDAPRRTRPSGDALELTRRAAAWQRRHSVACRPAQRLRRQSSGGDHAAPVAPLLLTTFSVEELLDRVLKALF
jgi:hypothetical protein